MTLAIIPADPEFDAALLLWLDYYIQTEEFDRSLPGAWSPHERDSWIPLDRRASTVFAAQLRDKLQIHTSRSDLMESARREALRLRHDDRVTLREHLQATSRRDH